LKAVAVCPRWLRTRFAVSHRLCQSHCGTKRTQPKQ
jgi:hypothetical protein